jgi:hypothetical protein
MDSNTDTDSQLLIVDTGGQKQKRKLAEVIWDKQKISSKIRK